MKPFFPRLTSIVCACIGIASISILSADHIVSEAIAEKIAESSGGDAEDYRKYSESLAATLDGMEPAKLTEALGDENLAKITSGGQNHSSPEYQAALSAYGEALSAHQTAEQRFADAKAAVDAVLADEAGLKSDGIAGNYLSALVSALYEQRLAEVDVEITTAALETAHATLEAADSPSDDHGDEAESS